MRDPETVARQLEVLPAQAEGIVFAAATARGLVLPEPTAVRAASRLLVQHEVAAGLAMEMGAAPSHPDSARPGSRGDGPRPPHRVAALAAAAFGGLAPDGRELTRLVGEELDVVRQAIAHVAGPRGEAARRDTERAFAEAPVPLLNHPDLLDLLTVALDANDEALVLIAVIAENAARPGC
jgi:hypothetical protein